MILIVAAIAVCTASTPVQHCSERTAKDVLFPAACARAGACREGDLPALGAETTYVYPGNSVPYVCLHEAQAWAVSPGNDQHRIGRNEYLVVRCGRVSEILNRFGTI